MTYFSNSWISSYLVPRLNCKIRGKTENQLQLWQR